MLLSAHDQALLVAMHERLSALPDIVEWCGRLVPHEQPPRHTIPILRAIRNAVGAQQKLLIEMPPGCAKTTTVMKALAWWIKHFPADPCAYFTYNEKKGQSKSRQIRTYCRSVNVKVDKAADSKGEWRTTLGGGLLAGGVGGAFTGERVKGLFVLDDPYANRKDAESEAKREEVEWWVQDVALTRLYQGATPIIMHTRWTHRDIIGIYRNRPGWHVISLPAIAEADGDIMGRKIGDPLWPEIFPLEHLENVRKDIGEWAWASLYQQRPTPRGAQVFGEPARFDLGEFRWHGKRGVIALDPAATENTRADYSAFVVMAIEGHGKDTRAYIVHVEQHQREVPAIVARARALQERFRLPIAVEAVAGFKSVPQILRDLDPRLSIVEIKPTTDKFLRAQPAGAAWNDGRILVPIEAPWVKNYLAEMTIFTGLADVSDDQVDATAHAFNTLYRPAPDQRTKGVVESAGA